ncbi:thiolase [Nostoc sp. 3335mG]|nr:thiolase [Nostoc sp. 3335mG]
MREVYVAGVGMTPFGRHLDKTHTDLTRWSVKEALVDAGIAPSAIDMAVYANVTQGFVAGEMSIPAEYALRPLGISGVRAMHVEAACASATMAFHLAFDYIRAGLVDVALVVGTEKLYSDDPARKFAVFQQPLDIGEARRYLEITEGKLAPVPDGAGGPGVNALMDAYAAQARLHMATYGTTARQIAAVAAKNHAHSAHNPRSQYSNVMTVDEVLAARRVAWPLTVPMCAPISDGSAAAILCSAEHARKLGATIRVLACHSCTGSDRAPDDYAHHVTRGVSARAYEMAGLGPDAIDVVEVHDASSSGEIVQIEALRLCPPGEAGPCAERGEFSVGGRVPVNTSGGLVSKGHPLGATGLGQIFELVEQLRGVAGGRQVESARVAMAENSGGFYGVEDGMSCVTILASS